MALAYCIEVRGSVVAKDWACQNCLHYKFHMIPFTTVLVKFEMEKEKESSDENPTFNCKPSWKRVIMEGNI